MNKKPRGRGRGAHGNASRKSAGRHNSGLPNIRDVATSEQPDIILKKLQLCSKRYTFEDIAMVSIESERGKMLKTSTLIELREVTLLTLTV